MKIAEINILVSEGCGCSNENSVSVLGAQSMVTIQHQVCELKSRDKDIFLLGMLKTDQHKAYELMFVTLQARLLAIAQP